MVATGNVEITSTGRVSGDIETDSLVVSKGGIFNGNVSKLRHAAEITTEYPAADVEPRHRRKRPA